ncbi:MAG: DUF4358 domain-containing protein [Clostridiales bacterium]|jgi:hypothetical protein|nr:DUF4358 domain-containing protein [Clostridiales bacterium]
MRAKHLLLLLALVLPAGCVAVNMPKKTASMDAVESAIKAQIKLDLIESGKYDETDFTDKKIPGYNALRLKDAQFDLPYVEDLDGLRDAVVVTSIFNNNADIIAVLKAEDEESADRAVAVLGKLHEEQLKRLKTYLPDQADKIDKFILKRADFYVIYIVYENPGDMETAIFKVIR